MVSAFEQKKNIAFAQINKFYNLTPFQIRALEDFIILLLRESTQFNLVGKSTVDDLWSRHVLDSAQLIKFIPDKNIKLADFGSGAGFPGFILALLGVKEVHLIEKSFRKSEFLRQAKMLASRGVFIHQAKLEELSDRKYDVITSRALASLEKLVEYSKKFLKNDGYSLFLKGKNLDQELDLAKKSHDFKYELFESVTAPESKIIKIWGIK